MDPRNRFRRIDSLAYVACPWPAWRSGTTNRVVVPARHAGNRYLFSLKVYKYGLSFLVAILFVIPSYYCTTVLYVYYISKLT
jgi:hypothetical protein